MVDLDNSLFSRSAPLVSNNSQSFSVAEGIQLGPPNLVSISSDPETATRGPINLDTLFPLNLPAASRLERVGLASKNANWRLRKLISQLSISSSPERNTCDIGASPKSKTVESHDFQPTERPGQLLLCFGRTKR